MPGERSHRVCPIRSDLVVLFPIACASLLLCWVTLIFFVDTTQTPNLLRFLMDNGLGENNDNSSLIDPEANSTVLEQAEEQHFSNAITTLLLNITLIGCLLLAYFVKKFKIYYLPESAGAILVGMVVGLIATLSTDNLELFEFSPEVFFFILLPPIIFEAGYSLKKKAFFDNIGAITLYAMLGTIISTFIVGGLSFWVASHTGLFSSAIDTHNPMEALLFGALISAVDPVATLSIMGNAELQCDPLLYSLVFGESVLNDAIAISLFNVFAKYYDPDGPDLNSQQIPAALLTFLLVSALSVCVGISLGMVCSFMYKHTTLSDYPHLETSLLFSFCYLCYSTAEAFGLSGIMALFFQGVILSHYNSYNLSNTAHVASEQIFATMATLAETAVFLYMGMGVFTGRFDSFDPFFSLMALLLCVVGRFFNIFPLSLIANLCRDYRNRIPIEMQCVLWFAGLRGAIAFALAVNMPGLHRETYATTTLFICIFTTVVCGGSTEFVLTRFGMKQESKDDTEMDDDSDRMDVSPRMLSTSRNRPEYDLTRRASRRVYGGAKRLWKQFDDDVLKVYFGGSTSVMSAENGVGRNADDHLGNYELSNQRETFRTIVYDDDDDLGDDELNDNRERY